jgi:hypothetical protein
MVGAQAYGILSFTNLTPGVGAILPGAYNVGTATQDPANINAGLLRINFLTPFTVPPVLVVQPIRVGVDWVAAALNPFMPDGVNVHRNVFPIPPVNAVDGTVDEVINYLPVEVYESGVLPVDGRPMPESSRIELENNLLNYRLLAVERDHFTVQFASYIGKKIRIKPYQLDGTAGLDAVQQGTVTEILFNFIACGDLNVL